MSPSPPAPPMPVALCLAGLRVLLVGGGAEAEDKLPKLRAAGALLDLVAEEVPDSVARAARLGHVSWWARALVASDLRGADVVVLLVEDAALAASLRAQKRKYGYLFAAIDQPAVSDFHFVSVVARGPLRIGISTGGRAPLLARAMRHALAAGLDQHFVDFAERMAALRVRYRALPKAERITQLARAFAGFALELSVRYPERLPDGAELPEPTDATRDGLG